MIQAVREQIEHIRRTAKERIEQAASISALGAVRIEILGKKGKLTQLLRGMGSLPAEERPVMGRLVNSVRDEVEQLLQARGEALRDAALEERLKAESVDVTLPGRLVPRGSPPLDVGIG